MRAGKRPVREITVGGVPGAEERARLDALSRYKIAGTDPERRFDRIVSLAADLFAAPMAFLNLVGEDRQWSKSRIGSTVAEIPREQSFCTHTIQSAELLVVPDTGLDPRFAANVPVAGPPHIRFYAGAPLVTHDGHRIGTVCVADVRPRKTLQERERRALRGLAETLMAEIELRRSERLRSTMTGFAEGNALSILAFDPQGTILFANRASTELFDHTREALVGSSIDLILPERLRGGSRLARLIALGEGRLAGRTFESIARKRDGREFPVEFSVSAWEDAAGTCMGVILRDMTEHHRQDERLLHLANHDPLTGLINRRCLVDRLQKTFRRATPLTVVLLDLDGFKDINDTVGRAIGDALLEKVAVRLEDRFAGRATVARVGGDEFALLRQDSGEPALAEAWAAAILDVLQTPFEVDRHVFHLTASAGIALKPGHGHDAEDLIAGAALALRRAKLAGGHVALIFRAEMRDAAVTRRTMQDELLGALRDGALVLHYQPQVVLDSGRLCGVEVLLRWQHPTRGLLQPGDFIQAIEASPLTLAVGWWVLEEACRQLASWRRAGLPDVRIAVNLFSAQFRSATLAREVLDILERHGIEPGLLELEITETIALRTDDHALAAVHELRQRGVGIAFDDFGTGYASMSMLKQFPLTTLKIDRGFVHGLLTDTCDAAITRATLALGLELGLDTVAEGIESTQQAELLRSLGCKVGQGYLFGRPMPATAFAERLANTPARQALSAT